MEQVKVSVIIPVYNVETYIRECIDSLVNQTLKEIEIICVDDGSTDSSLEILKEYEKNDSRVIVLQQQNLFAGVARNNGLKIARGEYVIFLDSDDFFDETLLEKTYNQGVNTNADVIFFGAKKYHDVNQEFQEAPWYFNRKLLPEDMEVFSRKDAPETLLRITAPMPWTKLFKREFVNAAGLQFQPLHNSNDVFFTLSAVSEADRISYVDDDLVFYRVGTTQNLQSTKSKNPLCFMKAYEAVYNELVSKNILDEVKQSFFDVVISGCEHNIESNKDFDVRMTIIEAIAKSDFIMNVVLAEDIEFYCNKNRYGKVLGCRAAYEQRQRLIELSEDKQVTCIKENELTTTPCVSVIIPIYNVELYLKECLDSIQGQTLENIEIICINDGSTDDSLDVLKQCAKNDKRVSIYNKLNSGQSASRNIGLEHAGGEYVYFMDSDDVLELNALEILYNNATENGNADIVMFNASSFSDSEDCEEELELYKDYYNRTRVYDGVFSGDEMANSLILHKDYRCSPCLQLIRREHLVKNNISFYVGILHEDELFTITSLVLAEKAMLINDVLFNRRLRPNSTMTSTVLFKNVYGLFCAANGLMDFIKANELSNSGLMAVDSRLTALLRTARRKYNNLAPEERIARYGISKKHQILFEQLVVAPATQDLMLYRANKKIDKQDKKIRKNNKKIKRLKKRVKRLNRKTNSTSYKLFRLIISPITLSKKILKKLTGK